MERLLLVRPTSCVCRELLAPLGYGLTVAGHSLGASTACLVTRLLQAEVSAWHPVSSRFATGCDVPGIRTQPLSEAAGFWMLDSESLDNRLPAFWGLSWHAYHEMLSHLWW